MAARALLPIATEHDLILTHGNGPQVGLLALQNAAYRPDEPYPLDILDAETEGMIGYLLEQELVVDDRARRQPLASCRSLTPSRLGSWSSPSSSCWFVSA